MTNGSKIVDTKSSLVKDSYYWKNSSGGLHVHIGPVDNAFVIGGSSGAISLVASLLKVEEAGTVAAALVLIIIVVDQYECNKDGSSIYYINESIKIDSSLYYNARIADNKRKNWETLLFTTHIKILT